MGEMPRAVPMCQTRGTQHSLLPWARLDPAQYFAGTTRKMGLGLGCHGGTGQEGRIQPCLYRGAAACQGRC